MEQDERFNVRVGDILDVFYQATEPWGIAIVRALDTFKFSDGRIEAGHPHAILLEYMLANKEHAWYRDIIWRNSMDMDAHRLLGNIYDREETE